MTLPASTTSHVTPDISGYTIVEPLYIGSRTAVYRALQISTQESVVIKVLRREYPSFGELMQFRNQYTIAKNLPIPGIVHPLSIEPLGSGYALVMEDVGGIALGQYIQQQSLDLADVLVIALQITDILHDLSQHRVVHKDIKPANILIHPESKQVKLIDFSIASLLPRETQEIQNPNVLEGTLAYIAPEQTGRMNRGIDYRADFYSLGVILYQLLTRTLPFTSEDPLELMHCHMAKIPAPVVQINPDVPAVVGAIVAKLMAKNAEDRYQSALGLKHDLEQCLTQWRETGAIEPFELGQRDVSDRFIIPEKLYGRDAEVQTLLKAFERVADGASELILVAGFSGIGKTSVVNEVHKPIARQRGYFIKGKFDQFNRNIPFSAFVQAFRDLMGQLLSETDAQLQAWKAKILAAVGENGQVIVDVIPELAEIIGSQPSITELSGSAAQNRFNLLFQKFIQVFTTPDHPLVMFLDDLQWADLASLNLLKLLMSEASSGYLLILGAYRDNEVFPAHPLMLTLEEIQEAQATLNTITLGPLLETTVNQLVADTLSCAVELAQPLTQLVYQKTQGNPFFTTQFLKALHEEGWIQFQPELGFWQCDLASVWQLTLTDDVVVFMAQQLQKLPVETQTVLKFAACIGNQFDLATLAIVYQQPQTTTAAALWKALQEGLILPTSQVYRFFQGAEPVDLQTSVHLTYRFLHDRVQQAAYCLIPEHQKQAIHYQIGKLLWGNLSIAERDDRIFDVVNQINFGKSLINNEPEKLQFAELNLKAGYKAKASTAYEAAKTYSQEGIDLLAADCWTDTYRLAFDLHFNLAEAALMSSDFQLLEKTILALLKFANSTVDQAKIHVLRVDQYSLQGQFSEAIEAGLAGLRHLGIMIDREALHQLAQDEFAAVEECLKDRPIATLLDLPAATDPEVRAAIELLIILQPPAYIIADFDLYSFATFRAVRLSIQKGNIGESIKAYVSYGFLIGLMHGQYQRGVEFADLALQLSHKLNSKFQQSRVCFLSGYAIQVWAKPIAGAAEMNYQGFLAGLESGENIHAGYNLYGNILNRLFHGENLADIAIDIEKFWLIGEKLQHDFLLSMLDASRFFVNSLAQPLEEPESLIVAEEAWVERSETFKSYTALGTYYILQMHRACLVQGFKPAMHYVTEASKFLSGCAGFTTSAGYYFYSSLILCDSYPSLSEAERTDALQQIETCQAQLKTWSASCSENFLQKYLLVEAERSRIAGQFVEALDLYDRAIAAAKANGYIHEAALANELAARFYLAWGKEKVAAGYMQEAYYCYARWGAKAKIQDLEGHYFNLLAPILQQQRLSLSATETVSALPAASLSQLSGTQSSTSSSTSVSATLDLITVLKASQTLSSEIELDKLLAALLHTMLENAGADKGVLLMPHEHQWFVEAVATLDQSVQVQSIPVSDSPEVPHSLIHSVKRSLQPAVIVDAASHPILATDPYVAQQRPQSVLCTPILQQGKPVAILYLENHCTIGAFTRERVELLNLLCAQAAISLENAYLYQQAQTYGQQIEQSLTQLQSSEARFQKLADNVPGMIYQIRIQPDGSTITSYVSSGCQTLYQVAAEDLITGKYTLRDFEHPDDREGISQTMIRSIQTLTPFRYEWRIISGGTVKWVQAAAQPEQGENGEIIFDGLLVDITERKQIEAEQARLLAILESTSDFVGTTDPTGKILYFNRSWRQLLHLADTDAAKGSDISQHYPAWAFEIITNQALPEAVRSGMWLGETAILDSAGQEIPVSQVVLAQKSSNGNVEYFATILRDISKIKAAETALRISEKNLRTIFDCSNTAIFVHDLEGGLLDVNHRVLEMYEIASREEALMLSALDYSAPDNPLDQVPVLWSRALAGETVCFEWKSQRPKDGSVFDAEIVLNKITLNDKDVILSSIQDISERQAALRERERAEASLLQKSQELAQALHDLQSTQLQMVQNEKMASLGNLVAGVAHEINNPIGFLNGSISNAKEYVQDCLGHLALYQQHYPHPAAPIQDNAEDIDLEFLSEDLPKLLHSMQGATDRIKSISNSLRTFSRADTEYKVWANLHEGIESALLILKYRLKANEQRPMIEVVQSYDDLSEIKCFPGQLNQVFMNILANAIDMFDEVAQSATFAEIEAKCQRILIQTKLIEQNTVEIRISDNGRGMTEEIKARIFDHLFTTKSVGKGTGLGLAIAHQIVVEKHGGSLEVQSEIGQGTMFVIRLPITSES